MGGMLRQAAARCNRSGDDRHRQRADGRCQQCGRPLRLPQAAYPPPRESCVRGADRAAVDKCFASRLGLGCFKEEVNARHRPPMHFPWDGSRDESGYVSRSPYELPVRDHPRIHRAGCRQAREVIEARDGRVRMVTSAIREERVLGHDRRPTKECDSALNDKQWMSAHQAGGKGSPR